MDKSIEKIKQGAFLTVQKGELLNTMTIGWATIGIIWSKPILMVAVRPTRFTFGIIDAIDNFTVSIPFENKKDQLSFCGTKSGRDINKFKECGLTILPAQKVGSPIIECDGLHYECAIVFKAPMDGNKLIAGYQGIYPKKDYHTLYFGEIVDCYEI
jgi:flavin reductase (DIM6/NTAB) family NADH-FMN oxidoreductase RutF